jgi:hypothetical protein
MSFADSALAEALPLVAVIFTGWPQALELPIAMKIVPVDWLPAAMLAYSQLAPLSVGWHDQPPPWPPCPPWPPPIIQVPAGRVIEAVTWPVAAVPLLLTVNTTWAPPQGDP